MYLKKKILPSLIALTLMVIPGFVLAQDEGTGQYEDMEKIQNENYEYMKKIQRIITDYPAFAYTYNYEDGKVKSVEVTGVEDEYDKKRLEVILLDLKSNKNEIKNKANRLGVFYSVDEEPIYNGGHDALQEQILSNLKYPEAAKDWGVEGTIYLKFVVGEDGEIPFATASQDIETSVEAYSRDLEQQAVKALKATSGNWKPGEVGDVDVPSMVVLPVTFDFEKDPSIPTLIR